MLHGPLTSNLIFFAIPIALSSMLQQLFNAADTSVVGHFANADALAAVGTNGEIVALLVTLSAGLATGANVLIARYIGEDRIEHIPGAVTYRTAFCPDFRNLRCSAGTIYRPSTADCHSDTNRYIRLCHFIFADLLYRVSVSDAL